MNIRLQRAQMVLASVFVVFLILQIGMIIYVYSLEGIYPEDVTNILLKMLIIYSVPLGIILGGVFGKGIRSKTNAPVVAFFLALVLAIVWNILLAWRGIAFALTTDDSVSQLINYLDVVATASTFLVAGSLSYFFSKEEK